MKLFRRRLKPADFVLYCRRCERMTDLEALMKSTADDQEGP